MKLAIIEDDKTISFAVKRYLEKSGMEVESFESLASVMEIDIKKFDLIILDINLPDGSGFDYLKYIREFSDIPIIMLTVKDAEKYVLQGFSYGADEYITKPFSLAILKARIENVLKRRGLMDENLVFHALELNLPATTAKIHGKNIDLNKQEFAVLELLLENKNLNIPRERIIDYVWAEDEYEVNDNTLTVTIKRLRNKLGNYGKHIQTVRGIGYRWESDDA